jgi:hypothetical protein
MTQYIVTANENEWCMKDDDHSMREVKRGYYGSWGTAVLAIAKDKDRRDRLQIRITKRHTRSTSKNWELTVGLKPDTVQSLIEWFKAYAQEPATNGGNEQASAATNSLSKSPTTSAAP